MIAQQVTLRELAARQDAEASEPFALGRLWAEVRAGTWTFCDVFETDSRCFGLVQHVPEGPPQPLNPRKLRLFERVLLGSPPKVVAIDCQRSLSSVTAAMQDSLRRMGLSGRGSQIPVLLTMAAFAGHKPEGAILGRLSGLQLEREAYWVISVARPDLRFPVALSSAETEVLRALLAGRTYAQISGERATSPRTVANQLATAFKKLGVSGRRATIERLIQHSVQQG